jgi:hypothetical protein
MNRLNRHVFDHLRRLLTFGVTTQVLKLERHKARVCMLLDATKDIDRSFFTDDQTKDVRYSLSQWLCTLLNLTIHQLAMFQAIVQDDVASMRRLVAQWSLEEENSVRVAICLDHMLSLPQQLDNSTRSELLVVLQLYLSYAGRVRLVGSTQQAIRKNLERITSLMNLKVNPQTFRYSVPASAFIRLWTDSQRSAKKSLSGSQVYTWTSLTREDALVLAKEAFGARIHHMLTSAATQCLRSPEFASLPKGANSVGDTNHCIQWRQGRLDLYHGVLRMVALVSIYFVVNFYES